MKDIEQNKNIPTTEEINQQYNSFLHQLDLCALHLRPLVRFDTSEMDDLLDLIETGNATYIDLLKKQLTM